MEVIARRLDHLRGNTPDVSPYNTSEENSRIIARKNNKKFVNQQIKQREKELSHLPKGIVKKRKSSINFRLPDTPPLTPQQDDEYWNDVGENWLSTPASTISGPPKPLFHYDRDFPPLNKTILSKNLLPITPSRELPLITPSSFRETSILFAEGSVSPLRNKLPSIAPLPSRPVVDNFSGPITEITDKKKQYNFSNSKTDSFTTNWSTTIISTITKNFSRCFDSTIEKTSNAFKERIENIEELVKKVGSEENDGIFYWRHNFKI